MRLLGLGFANLFSRKKADVEVLTTISSAAGDAMLDSAGVLSLVGAWPAGKGTVQVPDVAGKPWAKAAALARERGLEVTLKELADSDKDAGTISAQSPAAGSTVETGSTIELTVSKGPGAASQEVPPLAGKPWDEAQEAAAAAKLVLKLKDLAYDPKMDKGAIVSQEIPAGTKVAAQTAVDVTVSMGQQ